VIIGVLGLYAVLKLTNPMWLILMFGGSIPALIVIGRWHLYKASKTQEFIQNTKGSVLGYKPYNLQLKRTEATEQILEELKKLNRIAS